MMRICLNIIVHIRKLLPNEIKELVVKVPDKESEDILFVNLYL